MVLIITTSTLSDCHSQIQQNYLTILMNIELKINTRVAKTNSIMSQTAAHGIK